VKTELRDARASERFIFAARQYDPVHGTARLTYRFDDGPELVETFCFPHAPWPPEASRQAAFSRALMLLHLIAGISYFKAGLSPVLAFDGEPPDSLLAGFLDELYLQGLAEFAFVNDLDLTGKIRFEENGKPPHPLSLILPDRALVAMGGGKDSLVGLDLLIKAGVEVQPVCVGGSELIRNTVRAAGLPLLQIERQLAPELAELNRLGGWNGHVPVTAINSAVLLCAGILYGFKYVVFSNERSADEPTRININGDPVNHQYSKSSKFEQGLRRIVQEQVSPDIEYFSILRPFSELDIVRRFSRMTAFHAVYSSCNRNFHIDGPRIPGRWCRDCPKCRFAALSLALFMTPGEVRNIIGDDLLDRPEQIDGFRALCGLGRDKPFECVGETGESRAGMLALAHDSAWRNHAVVRALSPELAELAVPELEELLKPASRHCIPKALKSVLD
jgi:hypothetical protein